MNDTTIIRRQLLTYVTQKNDIVCPVDDTEFLEEFGSLCNALTYVRENSIKVYGLFYLTALFAVAEIPFFITFGLSLAFGAPLFGIISLLMGVSGVLLMSLFKNRLLRCLALVSLDGKSNKLYCDEQKEALMWLNQHKDTWSINDFKQLLENKNLSQWGRQWVNEQLIHRIEQEEQAKQEELFVNISVPSSLENLASKEMHHRGLKI